MKNLFSKSLSKKKLAVISASFVVFAAATGFLFYETTKKTVALTLNGEEKVIKTHAAEIKDIFDELNIAVRSEDYVFPAANTKVENNIKVVWEQAKQVQIVQGEENKTVWTTATTVGELLKEHQIALSEHDKVLPKLDEKIKNDLEISIQKAFPLTVIDGGNKLEVWSTSTTVADFLVQQGIPLADSDRVEPNLEETITENGVVNVIRVEKVTDVVEEPISFAIETKKDGSLAQGTEKVITEGVNGLVAKEFEVVKENGQEISRKLISEKKIKDKQDKVVALGTKIIAQQVSRQAAQSEPSAGREFYVDSTAYTASCNGCSGVTATGVNLNANPNAKVIAVDPSVIPLGTKVYVDGYGYAVAADTGSAIKGHKIDVFFAGTSEAYRWGRKKVKIKILD
ncbi:G5 and 3D domain-containing protein [Bacillus canaveralius]|uniref:G5 and 3D domain-containing protein n=1 Tax=Bacillus canaveralius TaxID=1403243 RepID=UPI000F78B0E7|nr:G5 and 3D domain-containing protein [Bacillus canaveralius]RSK56854.1 DUF348 domain-containing protein [Bacillus canaveralius]